MVLSSQSRIFIEGNSMQVFRPITYLPVFILGLFLFSVNASCQADNPYRHLARAVELYNEGRYDESFDETTQQIELDEHCALAYYYRARIRVMRSDYRRAGLSIIAALRDSSGYTDAVGLHAYILRETGQHDDALNEWRRFIEDAGATGEEITLDSIMLPDEYYRQLERIRTAEREQSAPKPEESCRGYGGNRHAAPADSGLYRKQGVRRKPTAWRGG